MSGGVGLDKKRDYNSGGLFEIRDRERRVPGDYIGRVDDVSSDDVDQDGRVIHKI